MTTLDTTYLQRCIDTLAKSLEYLSKSEEGSIEYEMFRNSLVKGFEMTLEQSGKLLSKRLNPYFASKREVDKLTFKDIFRYAHKHGLLNKEELEHWLAYRDNRNDTVHNYGVAFTKETLALAHSLVNDAQSLIKSFNND